MSLSFVSSAVQRGTSDGGYEETPIESKESEAVNRRNAHKPLFDQLRSNQEDEQAKREEIQRGWAWRTWWWWWMGQRRRWLQ